MAASLSALACFLIGSLSPTAAFTPVAAVGSAAASSFKPGMSAGIRRALVTLPVKSKTPRAIPLLSSPVPGAVVWPAAGNASCVEATPALTAAPSSALAASCRLTIPRRR